MSPYTRAVSAMVVVLLMTAPAAAQDGADIGEEDAPGTTILAIERGEAPTTVYLEGAALVQVAEGEYVFSDGTGAIGIEVPEAAGDGLTPTLFELIGIEGTVGGPGVEVSRWVPLRVIAPAVIVEEPQVIDAFRSWIVAFGSQAPEPAE